MSSLSGETKNKPHPVRHLSVADNASEAAGEQNRCWHIKPALAQMRARAQANCCKNVTAVQQPALLEKQWLTCTSKLMPVEAVAQMLHIVLNVRDVHAIAASRKQCERGARHRRDQGPVRSGGKASGRCRQ
jgi:hypothetical protein